jgi:hypothetical protein
MQFDRKDDMITLSMDVDELSPIMLRVANAMINSDTIHTHALYWISTHKYSAYQQMMDCVDVREARISMSRQHAIKLLNELTDALGVAETSEKLARICVDCHRGYISEAGKAHECGVTK